MLVLLVEDDLGLAELTLEYLAAEGIEADIAYNGVMGLELIRAHRYDVIILDVMLPRLDGLSLCARLRELGITTPCLMLTARDSLDDKLAGFAQGADDYLVKPFDLPELVARLQVLARRRTAATPLLQVADLVLDTTTRQARRGERPLALSPAEWTLLECLMRASPEVVPRSELERLLWPDEPPSRDALKMQLYRLRQLVDSDRDRDRPLLHTLRGIGVALRADDGPAA